MGMQPARATSLPERFGVLRLLHVLGLVLVVTGVTVLFVPLSWADRLGARHGLDPARIRPDTGLAFTVGIDLEETSDWDGTSLLELHEDGRPLVAHALHQAIREQGGGRFSHWGQMLYLSSTDGSDPRENGRRYEIVVPPSAEQLGAWSRGAWVGLCAGALLALATGLTRAGRRARWMPLTGMAVTAVALGLGLDPYAGFASARLVREFTEQLEQATPDGAGVALPTASTLAPPRTIRLPADDPGFVVEGAAPEPTPPTTLTLVPGEGVEQRDGVLLLDPGERLHSSGPIDVTAGRLAVLIIRARIRSGSAIRLTFHTDLPVEALGAAQLVVPVSPSDDWQTLRITRPLDRDRVARSLVTGDARLTRIELGPLDSLDDSLALEIEPLVLVDEAGLYSRAASGSDWFERDASFRPVRWQSTAGTFSMPWPAEARGRLRGGVAMIAGDAGGSASVRVELEDAAGQRVLLHEGAVTRGDGWVPLDLELPTELHPARLLLGASGLPAGSALGWSGWRAVDTSRPARRAVLVLVDTLRADALGCLGHATNRTPVLDQLASEGALFERCYSQAFWTRPSVPSLMSGRYVRATGVHAAGLYLPDSYETLAESFAAAGYQSVGFVSNAHAGPAAGLLQGLDEMLLRTDIDDTERFLAEVVSPRLEQSLDDDLFAWIHLMEVHGPYGPEQKPEAWVPPAGGTPVAWDERYDREWNPDPTAESRVALYDADLESLDSDLGGFLAAWLPRWSATGSAPVIAVTSDHGEFLGEYDRWGHEWDRLLPETVHVPLILWAPGRLDGGLRWDRPVENIDVGATLLDLAGARPWDALRELPDRGRSLLAVVRGHGRAPDAAIAAYDRGNGRPGTLSLFLPDRDFIGERGSLTGTLGSSHAVFETIAAPRRLIDIGSDPRAPFERFWEVYLQTQEDARRVLWGRQATSAGQQIDAASVAQMQALGYLGR